MKKIIKEITAIFIVEISYKSLIFATFKFKKNSQYFRISYT